MLQNDNRLHISGWSIALTNSESGERWQKGGRRLWLDAGQYVKKRPIVGFIALRSAQTPAPVKILVVRSPLPLVGSRMDAQHPALSYQRRSSQLRRLQLQCQQSLGELSLHSCKIAAAPLSLSCSALLQTNAGTRRNPKSGVGCV